MINNVICNNCKKCLPCAADIDIPLVISFKDNIAKIKNNKSDLDKYINDDKLKIAMCNAQYCKRCNKCIRNCPMNIDIPMEIMLNLSEYKKIQLS